MKANTAEPAIAAVYALPMVSATDNGEHLVRDNIATVAAVFGTAATALCGATVAPAPLFQVPGHACGDCPAAASAAGLATP
jgi:hypothetical protein